MAIQNKPTDFESRSGLITRGTRAVTSSTGQTGTVQIDGGAAIAKNLIVGSSASIYGPVFLADSLIVSTTATFLGNIQLAGIVGADTQVNNLLVNNISTLSGPVIVYNSATFYGPLYLQGTSSTLNVSASTATFGGNVLINTPILANENGTGALALTAGGLYINQNLVVASTLSSLVTTASNSIYTLGGVGVGKDLLVRGDTLIHGNLTVLGTQTIINSTSTSISDPVIDIGTAPNNAPLTVDDGLSKGLVIHYYTTADNHMFVGRSASTGRLVIRDLIDPGYSGNIPNENYINNGVWGGLDLGSLNVYDATITTNSATGALKVVGGISSQNNIYAAGNIYSYNTVTGKAVIGNTVAANNLTQNRLVFSNQLHQLSDTSTLYVSNGDLAGRVWYSNSATNLAGGMAYDLPYQAAPGVTNFLSIAGTGGYVLQSDGAQFFWGMLPGNVATGSAFTATNLLGGFPGAIPYQVKFGQTSFTSNLAYNTATQRLTALRAAFTSTENATNTATGAVVITGGAAVGEDLWVGGAIYSQGSQVLTGSAGQYVSIIIAGTDTAVSTSTGNITIWNTSTLQSITDRGNSTTNSIVILNATDATSTNSGALQVTGGLGVGGDVVAQGGKFGNIQVGITNDNTIDNQTGNLTITASGGTVTVNNNLSITGTVNAAGTATFQKPVDITDSKNSISTVSGALTVLGGVGIGRDLHVGGTIVGTLSGTASSANNLTGGTTGQLVFQSASGVTAFTGPGTAGDILVSRGTSASGPTFQNTLTLSGTTESISSTTGALQVAGGVGIGKDLWVGGQAYIDGAIAVTSATVNLYASKTILTAGTDTAITTSTGNITIWNTSTLQSVTDRGATTTNAVSILNRLTVANTILAGTGLYNSGAGVDLLSYDPSVHYVSDSNGSDANDGHWLAAPYKTIKYALNQAMSGDTVFIQPGIYTEEFPITIPQGVSVRGAGLREVFVQPTTATNTASAFLLNGETSISDFTVGNFYKPGYAFQFAPGAKITTRSPYIERFSVITRGSTTSTSDPYGFNTADAGGGAYLDASVLDSTSLEPAMLWNEATFIVPNATGMYMTNGARAELLNGFFYFAETAVNAVSGTTGYGGAGQVKLRVTGTNGVFVAGDTITYKDPSGNVLASGTISNTASGGYVYLNSPVWGFNTVVDRTAKTVTTFGGAKLVTADQKFGSASLRITTSTDYAEVLHDGDFAFGPSSSYTIEAWIKPDAVGLGRTQNIVYKGTVESTGIRVGVSANNKATVRHGSAVITGTTTLSASAWNHIAMVRDAGSNSLTLYVNGVANGTTAATGSVINTDPVSIGSNGTQGFLGWIDELRISSIVRYSSAFTPSTTGLRSDPATVLMLHFDGADQSTVITDDAYATQNIYSTGSGPATAARITLADYHQFGAELRCIGSAAVFGNRGVVANGTGTDLKLIAFNLSFIGAGGDLTDDATLVCQENELVELNDGKIYYQTVDQNGDFRVGNNFLINQRTGEVSFGASAVNLTNVSSINVTNGVISTFITPGNISVGNLNLNGNTLASLSGNITIAPSGSLTTVDSNLQVNGSVNITQPSFINGSPIVTVGTIGTAGVSKIIAGTDTAITSATGQVTIWNTSTFQSVTDRGAATSNIINFLNNTNATTSTNGTVVVSGGQGIGRDLWVGGDIYAPNRIIANTITATNLIVTGNTYIPGGITATNFTTTELTVVGQTVLQALIAAIATVTNLTVSSLVDLGPMRVYGTFTGSTSTMANLRITDYTVATNTYTGALIVNGGVGVGGALYANGLYDEGSRVITQVNLPQFGVASIIAGTDTAVSTAAGVVTIWNTSTLQSITARGATTPSAITITNTNASVGSTAANALSVSGGVGIGASLLVGGNAVFNGNVTFNGTTTNVFSTNTVYTDNIIDQHVPSPAPWTVNDGKDIGTRFQIYNTTATSAFLGRINGSGYLEWYGTGVDTSSTNNITGVYGTFKTGSIILTDTTSSALTVAGGASFGGTLRAAEIFDNNNRVVTTVTPVSGTAIGIDAIVTTGTAATFRVNNLGVTATVGTTYIGVSSSTGTIYFTNLGVQTLTAGTDTAVSASTGTVVVWNTSTLQSVTARGATTPSAITISNVTQSASTNTGALTVTGGAGLGGNLYVGGNFVTDGSSQLQNLSAVSVTATSINVAYFTATVATVTNLTVHNSLYVSGASTLTNLSVTGNGTVNGTFTVTNTTPSSSTATGALTVAGGAGVAGNLWVGGTIYGALGGSINTSSNLANGLAGQIPYQFAPGQTTFSNSLTYTVNGLVIGNKTVSTGTQTGALVVGGGVGIGGSINVESTSYIHGAKILTSADLETVTNTATYITNDPGSVAGLTAIAGTSTVYGTYNFGSVADIQTFNDYNTATNTGFYSINDATGAPGFIVYIGFTNIVEFNRVVLNINYTANSGHTEEIDLYNWGTGSWDTFTTYSGSTNWFQFILGIIDSVPYISNGKVWARVYHVSSGNPTHRTWIDYAALEKSIQGGQGPRGATGAQGIQGPQGLTTTTTSTFIFNNYTASTGTNSGAVVVYGGVGIGGNLWVGSNTYINGALALTSATVDLYATKTAIFAGTDTAVNTSTGNVTIWNTSTLQSVTNRGSTTTNAINIANATSATSTATGALTVLGGVGIGGTLFVQGSIYAQGGLVGFSQNSIIQNTSSVVVTDTGTVQQVTVIIANSTMTTFTQTGVTVVGDVNATALYDSGRRVVTRVTPSGGTGITVSSVQQNGTATSFTINNTGVLSAAGSAYIGVSPNTGAITITNLGVQTISTGSGISVSTSTGSVTIVSIDNLQLVTDRGAVTTNAVNIHNETNASATNTGALQVLGGLGVGQNLYATQVYDSGSRVITSVTVATNGGLVGGGTITGPNGSVTLTNVGVTSINTGSGISVSTSTGSVTISSIDNLQLVTNRGNTTNNTIGIVNGTNASATNTGALQVLGGVGVGQSLYATNLYDSGNRVITSVTVNTVGAGLVGAGTITGPSGSFNLVNTGVTNLTGSAFVGVSTSTGSVVVTNLGVTNLTGSLNIGVSTSTGSVIVTNLGVTATVGTTYIGVSARTGTVYFTNLGVTDLSGTAYLGVSQSTGSIQLTNLGVQTAVGSTYIGVSQSTGSVTFTNLGVQQIFAGTDITVNANTGSVTVNDASTLQSVTGRGATTNNAITISNGTNSTTPVNGGALSVYGGAGVNGNLRVGGILFVNTISGAVINSATSVAIVNNNTETTTLYVTFVNTSTGYAGIQTSAISGLTYVPGNKSLGVNTANPAYNLDVNGGTRIAGITTITNTTVATNITSGALQVGGGVGVSGSLYASAIFDNSNRVITSVSVTAGTGLVGGGTVTGPSGSVTLTNVGVTSLTGSQNIGVSTSTGSVVVTNLGVTATVGTTYIGVSAQTGTVYFTNLGVTNLTGSAYLGVSQSTGSITLTNLGVQNITTGSGIGVTTSTGSVVISSIDNLQLVTDRGATTTNAVYIANATAGSSTQTGALVVTGGVGIGRNLYVGGSTYLAGDLYVDGTSYTLNSSNIETGNKILYLSTSSPNAIAAVNAGIAIGPVTGVYASLLFDGVSSWQSAASIVPTTNTYNLGSYNNPWNTSYSLNAVNTGTTNATSTQTGALQVAGGVGIGRDVIIGGNVGIKTNNPAYTLEVAGSFAAQTKSFVIDHPTKPGMRLRYGSLEGPENGVYVRGRLTGNNIIELPDYWIKLVDPNSITVDLTPMGKHQKLYVERIENNTVVVGNGNLFGKDVDCFYTVWAERCDVEKLTVEIFK